MLAPRQPMLTSLTPPLQALLIRRVCRSGRIQWIAGGFTVSQYLYLLAVIMLIRWLTRLGLFTASPLQGIVFFFPSHRVFPFSSLTCFYFFFFFFLEIVAPHWLLCPIRGVLRGLFGGKTADTNVSTPVCVYVYISSQQSVYILSVHVWNTKGLKIQRTMK